MPTTVLAECLVLLVLYLPPPILATLDRASYLSLGFAIEESFYTWLLSSQGCCLFLLVNLIVCGWVGGGKP